MVQGKGFWVQGKGSMAKSARFDGGSKSSSEKLVAVVFRPSRRRPLKPAGGRRRYLGRSVDGSGLAWSLHGVWSRLADQDRK